ncbi:MAG: glutaredoxin family protein [Xanthomonadales bacterium]|nr:glutaredoxin family protein [Xanthomonadales bacterium]
MPLTLFLKDECHLCDDALLVLARAGIADFESVYIEDSPDLMVRYGTRVPVLKADEGLELDWPFSVDDAAGAAAPRT